MMDILSSEKLADFFEPKEVAGLQYAKQLTESANRLVDSDIKAIKQAGFDDGQILEINQVVSYFNYVNRTVLGLGVTTEGDILGLSPGNSSNPDDWGHN